MKNNETDNPLYIVAYEYFLYKYGFKKISENKLLQLVASFHFNKEVPQIKLFGRFYGIFPEEYEYDDFDFYIRCLIQLDDNLTLVVSNIIMNGQHYVIYNKVLNIFKIVFPFYEIKLIFLIYLG